MTPRAGNAHRERSKALDIDARDAVRIMALHPEHAPACEAIGRNLPAWFGIEDGWKAMREAAAKGPGLVALDGDRVIGFLTLERHFPEAWEISWMAVDPAWRRRGIGRQLVDEAIARARLAGVAVLQVKTLADAHPSPEYAQTREFYRAMGFLRLEVFPDLWDPANPALLMIRPIAGP